MKLNKFFLVLGLIFYASSLLSSFAFAEERGLEVDYPEMGGEKISTSTTVSEYAVYIFNFCIIIAAIAAFAVLIYGGIRYLLSLNNPGNMKDARIWIYSGIVGLFLALVSYLILNTINPEIISPKLEEIKPRTGIHLMDQTGKIKYMADSQNKITFDPVSLEFINTEEELYSVFVCAEEEFDGEKSKELINNGKGTTYPVSNVNSIYFLWNRPGVYLYEKAGFSTPPPPRFFQSGERYLAKLDNKTKSIRIKDPGEEKDFSFLAILFSDIEFEGEKGIGVAIKDSYNINYVKNQISSIEVSYVFPLNSSQANDGEVIFYDDIDCHKEKQSLSSNSGASSGSNHFSEFNKFGKSVNFTFPVLSFEIKGNAWVIFNTEKNFKGRSEIFKEEGCYPTLKSTYIYLPHPDDELAPKTATVFFSPK